MLAAWFIIIDSSTRNKTSTVIKDYYTYWYIFVVCWLVKGRASEEGGNWLPNEKKEKVTYWDRGAKYSKHIKYCIWLIASAKIIGCLSGNGNVSM